MPSNRIFGNKDDDDDVYRNLFWTNKRKKNEKLC